MTQETTLRATRQSPLFEEVEKESSSRRKCATQPIADLTGANPNVYLEWAMPGVVGAQRYSWYAIHPS